ncbi:hypothetical protein WL99_28770 [Burkholderia cepacia]|uniref:hypothetical protein n=1 Tax=Burkholderia cepacia TaxID=292 RepID=UPI00075649BF|nr:hypothetical protein [Burkholderia cepacia]KVW05379.1 hypothetical protein WK91_02025 [Burkholderia cepacia]KWH21814.1 hypothetical protein WL99_28770 [Burkholderia cepacia]
MSAKHDLFASPAGGDAPAAVPAGSPQVATQHDDWVARTQRRYLVNMARRMPGLRARGDAHRAAAEARFVLLKLNGMAGEW